MNANNRLYSIVILVAGIAAALVFLLFQSALHIMYESSAEASNFNRFIFPIALLAVVAGFFVRVKSLTSKMLVAGGALLLVTALLSVVAGLTFGHALKTENFLFYFLSCGLSLIVLAFTVAILLRFLLYSWVVDGLQTLKLAAFFTLGMAAGYLLFMGVGALSAVPAFGTWYLVLLLMGAAWFVARKEQPMVAE